MNILLGVLIGIFCLLFLVTIHEFGHFIMARKNGVRVLEFGIGFPPRLAAWTKREDGKWHKIVKDDWKKPQKQLIFSLNWLPIGGFCQMDGESDADTKEKTFGAGTFWTKTKILFGGVLMNWLAAFIIFTVVSWIGIPIILENQFSIESDINRYSDTRTVYITEIQEDSPAKHASLEKGDEILEIASSEEKINPHIPNDVISFNEKYAGNEIKMQIRRNTTCENEISDCNTEPKLLDLTIKLNEKTDENSRPLGAALNYYGVETKSYTWSAPIVGIGVTTQLTGETFKGLGQMLWNLISGAASQLSFNSETREIGRKALSTAGESVTGPIGIVSLFTNFVGDPSFTFYIFGLISVSLACMNILPIPALDGGRWLMIFIARLKHKRLTKEAEEKIVSRALLILFAIMIIVTILDVTRIF